ncbi:hypothetical protein [Streptomyces sp. NPDC018000]
MSGRGAAASPGAVRLDRALACTITWDAIGAHFSSRALVLFLAAPEAG